MANIQKEEDGHTGTAQLILAVHSPNCFIPSKFHETLRQCFLQPFKRNQVNSLANTLGYFACQNNALSPESKQTFREISLPSLVLRLSVITRLVLRRPFSNQPRAPSQFKTMQLFRRFDPSCNNSHRVVSNESFRTINSAVF